MTINEGTTDRIIRAVLGVVLLSAALLLGGGWAWGSGIVGGVLLLTAAVGFCPLYALLGVNTCPVRR